MVCTGSGAFDCTGGVSRWFDHLINNVKELRRADAASAASVTTPPAQAVTQEAPSVPAVEVPSKLRMLLILERIEVLNDGTAGSTSWSFEVEAGGESLFALPARDYSDSEATRVVTLRHTDPSMARVVLVPGQEMLIRVTGKSSSFLRSRLAIGTAMLTSHGTLDSIRVMTGNEGAGGSFVFRFSAMPAVQE